MSKCIALIPAYEPERILVALVSRLKDEGFEIIVVNDGSGGKYYDLFSEVSLYATVLTHHTNEGKGKALRTGLSYIKEQFKERCTIVTMDADGQHSVKDAIKLSYAAGRQPDTLILGSRSLKENQVPLRSRFGNTATRFVYRLSTGVKVHDTQTGLRAFGSELLPELLAITGERYEYEMNMLLEFAQKHIPIQEIPIETIYIDNNAASHFDTLRDSYRVYREILKFSASSFAGFLVDYVLYSLLLLITGSLVFSNIAARVVSASVNYTLNSRQVFKNKNGGAKSALQYFLLAAVILAGNTTVLEVLAGSCGIQKMAAKLLTEILFFILSWCVQRFVIFRRKGEEVDS